MRLLKDHPFAVETFFETSLVLTYAVNKEALVSLIPTCLTVDTLHDTIGFVAVAMVKTKALRPKGFPAFMGNDFFLTGYRIFVRYTNAHGKRLRGLYILGSQTDKGKMAFLGNIFTHYNYKTIDIDFRENDSSINVNSTKANLQVEVKKHTNNETPLPQHSPFKDWKEARRFAGPLPFTFTYDEPRKEVLIIEGVRENWTPTPVEVIQSNVGFIKNLGITTTLANAFMIKDIPYYWKKGKKEIWMP